MRTLMTTLLGLGLVVILASSARADTFACVNNSSGEVKIVTSCTVGTNASPCHNQDTCVDLSSLSLNVVCETEDASSGSFNIDALCAAGQVVVTGGYQCTDDLGNLLPILVEENTFHFSNVTPDGWQVIGFNEVGADGSASCRVCASCSTGSVQ